MERTTRVVIMRILAIPTLALGIIITSPFVHPVSAVMLSDFNNTVSDETAYNNMEYLMMRNLIIYAVGVVAHLLFVYGIIFYIKSGGKGTSAASAKRVILYAIISIVIILFLYAINNFIVSG